MRISLRWLHAWPVPEQLAIGKVKEAFDDDGNLIHDDIKERLENLVNCPKYNKRSFLSRCDSCQDRDSKMSSVAPIF